MKKFIKLHCINFKRNSIIELISPTVINTDLIVSINEEEVRNFCTGQWILFTRITLKDADDIFTYESVDNIYSLMESS
jgi:hypothetical protein